MNQILHETNLFIDRCANCTDRTNCHWFNMAAENVVLDDVTPEQYAAWTYEERANKIFENAGLPVGCHQQTFDALMQRVEDLLEDADMPCMTKELMYILNKMARLEKRLKRLDPDCKDVFDAPVRAVVERCLSAIDYYFLDNGLDIYPLIQNVHSDYHRTRMLHQNYVEGVVNVLLARSYKPTVEQILACDVPLWSLKLQKKSSPDKPESEPEAEQDDYGKDEKGDDSKYVIKDESVTFIGHYIEPHPVTRSFINLISNQDAIDFVKAVTISFGVDPNPSGAESDFFDTDFMTDHITPRRVYEFPQMKELCKEITKEVRARKSDEAQLNLYLSSLFYELQDILFVLFPPYFDDAHAKLNVVFSLAERYSGYTMDDFVDAWDRTLSHAEEYFDEEESQFYDQLYGWMHGVEFNERKVQNDPVLKNIANLRLLCKQYEAAIEAALLINKVKFGCLDYEKEYGIYCGPELSIEMIAAISGLNKTAIKRMTADLNHPLTRVLEGEPAIEDGTQIVHQCPYYEPKDSEIEQELPDLPQEEESPSISPLPANLQPVAAYFEALHEAGYINEQYKWVRTRNQTNYHAVWASKIICARDDNYTHDMIGEVFGIKHLGSYITDADSKPTIKSSVEKIFQDKGLSITTQ